MHIDKSIPKKYWQIESSNMQKAQYIMSVWVLQEADAEIEPGLQEIYLGVTLMKDKGWEHNYSGKALKLWCSSDTCERKERK